MNVSLYIINRNGCLGEPIPVLLAPNQIGGYIIAASEVLWAIVSQKPLLHLVNFLVIGLFLSSGQGGACQEVAASHLAAPTELRCDGHAEPVTVQNGKLNLSWKVMP